MDWDEEVETPYKTQTLTFVKQSRTHQVVFEPSANDPEKVKLVTVELESNIACSNRIKSAAFTQMKRRRSSYICSNSSF